MNTVQYQQFNPKTSGSIAESAVQILNQGLDMLSHVTHQIYQSQVPLAFNASIGGHYRHCLEHFQLLLDGMDSRTVNYDARDRNVQIEQDLEVAKQSTLDLIALLKGLKNEQFDLQLSIYSQTQYDSGQVHKAGSTLKRELMYGVAHSIHHFALIAVMAGYLKARLPKDFGIAPSTLHHRSTLAPKTLESSASRV